MLSKIDKWLEESVENLLLKIARRLNGLFNWVTNRNVMTMQAELSARVHRADGSVEDRGVIGRREVTDLGVAYIVDAFQAAAVLENMKYHACGTGVVAEDQTDTTLGTEVDARTAGSQTEGATANIYKTVGQVDFVATFAITEHGIFSASTAGTLLDRTVFSAINVDSGDSIEFTYELTLTAGG